MKFDTKIAVVLRDDLLLWQKLNVTAFTVSGIAGTVEGMNSGNLGGRTDFQPCLHSPEPLS